MKHKIRNRRFEFCSAKDQALKGFKLTGLTRRMAFLRLDRVVDFGEYARTQDSNYLMTGKGTATFVSKEKEKKFDLDDSNEYQSYEKFVFKSAFGDMNIKDENREIIRDYQLVESWESLDLNSGRVTKLEKVLMTLENC